MINTAAWSPKLEDRIESIHTPVLVSKVLEVMDLKPRGIYVDGTLGMGGHTEAMLRHCPEVGLIIGLDWDSSALEKAGERLKTFGDKVRLIKANFSRIPEVLYAEEISQVDGILLDLGLSSFQLDRSGRGFSFKKDEPLDMRMDPNGSVMAVDMVNHLPPDRLKELIQTFGEERWAGRITKFIAEYRKKAPILSTATLADIVSRAIPRRYHPRRIHPATRTFQALRIAVNRELDNLKEILDTGPSCLREGGRFCIISFHSLEDRLVKQAFREDPRLRPLFKKPYRPKPEEIEENPRARSAKLRAAERVNQH